MNDDNSLDGLPRILFWQARLATMTGNACGLLRMAGEPVNTQTLLAVLKSVPLTPWQVDDDERWQRSSFFYHCLVKAHERSDDPSLGDIGAYFIYLFSGNKATVERFALDSLVAILGEIDAALALEPKG